MCIFDLPHVCKSYLYLHVVCTLDISSIHVTGTSSLKDFNRKIVLFYIFKVRTGRHGTTPRAPGMPPLNV